MTKVTVLNLRKFPTALKEKVNHVVVKEKSLIGKRATQTAICVKLIELGLKHYSNGAKTRR